MNKILKLTTILALSTLSAFANNDKEITANFSVDNQDSSPYHLKLTSKSNPSDETIFEALANSKTDFKVKKSKSEWMNSILTIAELSHEINLSAIANESANHTQNIEHVSNDEVCTSKNGSFILNEFQNIKANTTKNLQKEGQKDMEIIIGKKYFLKKNQK